MPDTVTAHLRSDAGRTECGGKSFGWWRKAPFAIGRDVRPGGFRERPTVQGSVAATKTPTGYCGNTSRKARIFPAMTRTSSRLLRPNSTTAHGNDSVGKPRPKHSINSSQKHPIHQVLRQPLEFADQEDSIMSTIVVQAFITPRRSRPGGRRPGRGPRRRLRARRLDRRIRRRGRRGGQGRSSQSGRARPRLCCRSQDLRDLRRLLGRVGREYGDPAGEAV